MLLEKNKILLISGFTLFFLIIVSSVLFLQKLDNHLGQDSEIREELLVYTWTGDHYYRVIAEEFKKRYNIPVRIVVTNADVYIRKSISEGQSAEGSVDCMLVNSSYQLQQLYDKSILGDSFSQAYTPLYTTVSGFVFDSENFKNPPLNWEEFNKWIDDNPECFGFTAVNGEAGFSFIYSVLNQYNKEDDHVWEWFRSRRKSLLFTSSDYDTLRLFSSGKLKLGSVLEHQMLNAVKSGELSPSVKMYQPEFGSLSETYGFAIPENAPDKKGASLFVQFLTSLESRRTMIEMLSVRPVDPSWTEDYLTSPDAESFRNIRDSFKDKVLYY